MELLKSGVGPALNHAIILEVLSRT